MKAHQLSRYIAKPQALRRINRATTVGGEWNPKEKVTDQSHKRDPPSICMEVQQPLSLETDP